MGKKGRILMALVLAAVMLSTALPARANEDQGSYVGNAGSFEVIIGGNGETKSATNENESPWSVRGDDVFTEDGISGLGEGDMTDSEGNIKGDWVDIPKPLHVGYKDNDNDFQMDVYLQRYADGTGTLTESLRIKEIVKLTEGFEATFFKKGENSFIITVTWVAGQGFFYPDNPIEGEERGPQDGVGNVNEGQGIGEDDTDDHDPGILPIIYDIYDSSTVELNLTVDDDDEPTIQPGLPTLPKVGDLVGKEPIGKGIKPVEIGNSGRVREGTIGEGVMNP